MSPFRDATAQLSADVAVLAARRRAEAALTPSGWRSLHVQRTARIAFGVTATAAAAAIAAAMLDEAGGYTLMLIGGWAAALVAGAVAAAVASMQLRRAVAAAMATTGEPHHDLALLRALSPRRIELDLARRRGRASHGWPLIAAVLLGPHTLQLALGVVFRPSLEDADTWMFVTGAYSIHLFIYGACVAWLFPVRRRTWRPVVIVGLLSLVPGVLTLGISSLIVLATASVLILIAFRPMQRVMAREERVLAAAAAEVTAAEVAQNM
jgi:hypothetical protein